MVKTWKLCKSCSHKGCCTDSAVPLVFSLDYSELKSIKKTSNKFIDTKIVKGKKIKFIKKMEGKTTCIFFDEKEKRCSIYNNRPFDCRAYPFDILRVNNKYHWIVYSCNPESNWSWTETHLKALENDKQFNEVMEKIDIFAGHTEQIIPKESKKTPFTILREVKW